MARSPRLPDRRVVADVPSRVLAVYGHPDDAETAAGGTLAKWTAAGAEAWLLVCTRGDKGSDDATVDTDELTTRRRAESDAAAEVLGLAGLLRLDVADGELENTPVIREQIVRHVRTLQPDVVLCPDPTAVFFGDTYVNHHDHRACGWATIDAVSPAASNPHYFAEHLGAGLAVHRVRELYLSGTFEPNVWIDIGDSLERKIDALFCHTSQLSDTGPWFRDFLRERAEQVGREHGVRYSEAFRRISLT